MSKKQYAEIVDVEELRKVVKEYDKRKREAAKGREKRWWENDEAVAVFERMEAAGYCERVEGFVKPLPEQWKWRGTLSAWSFMARLMAEKLGMTTRGERTPYKKIAEAFCGIDKKKTRQARGYKNLYYEPRDAGKIRDFFK